MQVNSAPGGAGTVPRRRRPNALLAILVVAPTGEWPTSVAGVGSAVPREDADDVPKDEG